MRSVGAPCPVAGHENDTYPRQRPLRKPDGTRHEPMLADGSLSRHMNCWVCSRETYCFRKVHNSRRSKFAHAGCGESRSGPDLYGAAFV